MICRCAARRRVLPLRARPAGVAFTPPSPRVYGAIARPLRRNRQAFAVQSRGLKAVIAQLRRRQGVRAAGAGARLCGRKADPQPGRDGATEARGMVQR